MLTVNVLPHIQTFRIYSDLKELVPFQLWPKQIEAYDLMHAIRYIIFLKSRQSGFSTLTGADSLLQCMYQKDFTFLCLSVTGADSEEYLERSWQLYCKQDDCFKLAFPVKQKNVHEIIFENGSRFVSLSAQKGFGYTADRIVIDEFFKINPTRSKITITEVLTNVLPALTKRKGQIICVGTADGMNAQRNMYYDAKNGKSLFKTLFFSCYDDPDMTVEKRAELATTYADEESINQEYPRTDDEAFLASGRPRFNVKILQEYYFPNPLAIKFRGEIDDNDNLIANVKGRLILFEKYDPRGQYIVATDVAEGLAHGDYSVIKVLNRLTNDQVAEWRGHIEPADLGHIDVLLARHYNNAIIIIEANNHGIAAITNVLRVDHYPPRLVFQSTFERDKASDPYKRPEKRFGWFTSSKTKPVIIDCLSKKIKDKEIPSFTDEDVSELFTYVIDKTGATNAESGCFDDRVMTLAIAYYLIAFYPFEWIAPASTCQNCLYFNNDSEQKICNETGRFIKENSVCTEWVVDNRWLKIPKEAKQAKKINRSISRRKLK